MKPVQFSALYNIYLKPETTVSVKHQLDEVAEKKGDRWEYFKRPAFDIDSTMLAANKIENQVRITLDEPMDLLQLQTNQTPHARPHDYDLLVEDLLPQILKDQKNLDKLSELFPMGSFKETSQLMLGGLWSRLPEAVKLNPNLYGSDGKLILNYYIEKNNWDMFEALLSHPDFDPNKALTRSTTYPLLTATHLIAHPEYNQYFKALYDHPKTDLHFKDPSGETLSGWASRKGNFELLQYLEAKGAL